MSKSNCSTERKTVEKIFTFKYPTCTTNQEYVLDIPIKIPYKGSIKELVHRIESSFKLPCYIKDDLLNALESCVKEWTIKFHDDQAEELIDATKQGNLDVEEIIKNWEKIYKQKTIEYAEPIGTTDEELFAAAYHRLVHSPSLQPILQTEHTYGRDVTEVVVGRDKEYEELTQRYFKIFLSNIKKEANNSMKLTYLP